MRQSVLFWFKIAILGMLQILAWGSTYYAPAVMAKNWQEDLGLPMTSVMGGVSLALIVGGLSAPLAARIIQCFGGSVCLGSSSALFALGLGLLGSVSGLPGYVLAWLLLGTGMGLGLYDAAFSALGLYCGEDKVRARNAITGITLIAGFASTVAWPVLSALTDQVGWRTTCHLIALTHATAGLAGHLFLGFFRTSRFEASPAKPENDTRALHTHSFPKMSDSLCTTKPSEAGFMAMVGTFSLCYVISAGLSSNMLVVFERLNITAEEALRIALWLGPAQVGARLLVFVSGRFVSPWWTAMTGGLLLLLGLIAFGTLHNHEGLMLCAMLAYGAGNGLLTIARGTLPLALYTPADYVRRMGRQARCVTLSQACAPMIMAWLLGEMSATRLLAVLVCLACIALLGLVPCFYFLHSRS